MQFARPLRLCLALAVFATAGWLLRDYTTDDTFIHLRYATNLLEQGEFSFNPGEATYGATSPLWIYVLAGFLKLGLAPMAAAWTAGALAGLLALLLADAAVDRLTIGPSWKALALLLIVSDAWFLRWSFSGMETPLATGLLLLLLWPLFSGRDMQWGVGREHLWQRYLAWGVAAGLLGLVRPEFMLVGPLALPWLLWFEYFRVGATGEATDRWRARPHGPLVAAATGWLVTVGPWLVFARLTFGRWLPGTAAAKSGLVTLVPEDLVANLGRSIFQLAATQGFLWVGVVVLIAMVLVRNSREDLEEHVAGWMPRERESVDPIQPPPGFGPWSVWGPVALLGIVSTWTTALLGGYALKQVWIISRYLAPLAPPLILAMSVAAEWLITGPGTARGGRGAMKAVVVAAAVLTLVANAWLFNARIVPHARQLRTGVEECYLGFGAWIDEHAEPDAVVAALDIGAVGWASGRRVVDLMGLVSPEIRELGLGMGFEEMVASGVWLHASADGPPDYLVDRSLGAPRWEGRTVGGVHFELLDTCTMRGVGLREPQPWTVALYRLVSGGNRFRSSAGG